MKIYLATWLTDITLGKSLTKNNGNRRLLSYHFLLDQKIKTKDLKEYVHTGECDVRQKTKKKK